MGNKELLHAYKLVNTGLVHVKMDRTFNSIGSNVFFQFGREKKVEVIKGKKVIEKEWSLWISLASWRINKGDKYIVGSGEAPQTIQSNIPYLLGKRFQSFRFLSQFLDAEFNFEGDYQITTFFNWLEEDQWSLLMPGDSSIVVDCSNAKAIKNVQTMSQNFTIKENLKKIDSPLQNTAVTHVAFNEGNLPIFYFENDSSIHLNACAWRLEKNSNYMIGCLDDDPKKIKSQLTHLVGKKLNQVDVANAMMDARLQFEGGLVLKTFSCSHIEEQWKICEKGKSIFCAKIPLLDNDQSIQS